MIRKIITGVATAALILTGLASAPARAGDNDLAKTLAGIAVLAVIGKAISSDNKAKAEARRKQAELSAKNIALQKQKQQAARNNRIARARHSAENCLRERVIDGRIVKYFDKDCMWNSGNRLSRYR